MEEDASDTFSGRDSPGLSGIKWDSAGFHGSTGADETARPGGRGLPSTASRMAATASGERPFLTGAWPGAWPAPGAALAAFAAACSRWRRSLSVPSMRLRTSARRASSSGVGGVSRWLSSAMVESVIVRRVSIRMSPRATLGTLAERAHPHLVGAVGLLLLADQVADVLGVAADGRARARAALAPDEDRDFVDGGAVCDGRIDGLAKLRRQPRDRGTPERRGCRCFWGFVLHSAMLPRRAPALHRTMVRVAHARQPTRS